MTFLKRILLVDPEPRATKLVRTALEQTGRYLIKEEHDTHCAVNAARWFQPNLILFGLLNATAQASAIAQKLQQDASCRDTPVLFFSTTADDQRVVSGGIVSGYTFFANPLGNGDFVGCIAELLAGSAE